MMLDINKKTNLRAEFDNLDRTASSEFIMKQIAHGLAQDIGEEGIFKRKPVSTEIYFRDFVREINYPVQQDITDAAFGTDALHWNTNCQEVVALLGMGSGKDHTSAKLCSYTAYWLLCLKDPQGYFGLGRGTPIDIVNISINASLARDVYFRDFKQVLRATINPETNKSLFEELGVDLREGKDVQKTQVKFPHNIIAHSLNAKEEASIGMAPLVVVFDEVGGFEYEIADKIYSNVRETQSSRFPMGHGKRLLLSFPRSDNDYMMTRYNTSAQETGVYRLLKATWEVNLRVHQDDPEIQKEYLRNPEKARRVYECKVTVGETSYFRYPELILRGVTRERENPLIDKKQRIFDLNQVTFEPWFMGDPNLWYYLHVDLASGKEGADCAGLAMGHTITDMPIRHDAKLLQDLATQGIVINKFQQESGIGVYTDLLLQIRASKGREIIFDDLLLFILQLRDKYKFFLKKVTFDGWQGYSETQRLKEAGIDAEIYSVDRGLDAYDTLKGQIYNGLFNCYYHSILIRELKELQLISGKVDHPLKSYRRQAAEGDDRGSKDCSDSVAGMTSIAIQNYNSQFSAWWTGMGNRIPMTALIHPLEAQKQQEEWIAERVIANKERRDAQARAKLVKYGEIDTEEY